MESIEGIIDVDILTLETKISEFIPAENSEIVNMRFTLIALID